MSRTAVWYSILETIIADLEKLPRPFVDRQTLESLLGVGRRRAQQILAPCVNDQIGSNRIADRSAIIDRLRKLADGQNSIYELQRRKHVASVLSQLQDERRRPRLMVASPIAVVSQQIADLPPGVTLEAGRITIQFLQPQEALEKLLALAMAISNNPEQFHQEVS